MKIEADAFVDHPAADVFRAYRDELPRLVGELPQIREIIVESRIERGDIVDLVNLWHGDTPVPAIAQKIMPMKLSWHDRAAWNSSTLTARWEIESSVFTEAVRCHGENRFVDVGGSTRVEVRGEIRIDLSKVRLVPDLLVAPIASAIERLFVSQFTPSITTFCDALEVFLDNRPTFPPPSGPTPDTAGG